MLCVCVVYLLSYCVYTCILLFHLYVFFMFCVIIDRSVHSCMINVFNFQAEPWLK